MKQFHAQQRTRVKTTLKLVPFQLILTNTKTSRELLAPTRRTLMISAKRVGTVVALFASLILAATLASAQQPPPAASSTAQAQKTVEDFLRYFYALGPDIKITVGAPKHIGSSGISELPIEVKSPEGSDNLTMYLTNDGRYLLRGELSDLTKDPLAENIAKMKTAGAPIYGDPKAPITIVEYSDFQCPVCRSLHDAIRGILPKYPQVKLIFKDFPLDNIHPWAHTAALAGRCAYHQDPKAFWKLYDLIYDNQDLISASNAYDKMLEYAGKAGVNADTFKSCLSSPEAAADVDASLANGRLLDVRSTPTLFINGRRLVGADPHALQQYIDYEVVRLKSPKK
jgi:protein-disulfide isomerase